MEVCPKCDGHVQAQEIGDFWQHARQWHCINCGWRGPMPRFKTEEGRQNWLKAMAARRGRPRSKDAEARSPKPEARSPKPEARSPKPNSGSIAAVIAEIDAQIEKLQEARESLVAAQAILERS